MNISIFGLGYVGAVTAGCLTSRGHKIIGVDVSEKKVNAFRSGQSPIIEPELHDLLKQASECGNLDGATCVGDAIAVSEASIICVGTPSLEDGSLNLSYVRQVSSDVAKAIRAKRSLHTIIFRSTMLPGSTQSLVNDFFLDLMADELVEILYCPEFLREGTAVKDFRDPSLSVLGTSDGEFPKHASIGELFGGTPSILSWDGAELIKYTCNYFHAVKVVFANEIGRIGKSVGVDSRKVMDVICKDNRLNISTYYMKPGNPFGGSCLPKDVSALSAYAKKEGIDLPMLKSVVPSNKAHLQALLKQIEATSAQSVAIIGLAFKNDTDDLRGSPMVSVAEFLLRQGKQVKIYDPHLNMAELMGTNEQVISSTMPHLADLLTVSAATAIEGVDLVIVSQKNTDLKELEHAILPSQIVLDVNGWPELSIVKGVYSGSCW
jgi:GDP-mannose 6-dehydrogenase